MDELRKPANFNKLKAFFAELRSVGFNLQRVPGIFTVNRLPVRKDEALRLLRLLPEFAGEDFKKDEYLSQFLLKNQTKLAGLLDGLSPEQQAELRDLLLKPEIAATEQISQPAVQGPAEAGAVSQPPLSGGSVAGAPFGMPTAPVAPSMPRMMRNIPHAPEAPKPDIAITKPVQKPGTPSGRKLNIPSVRNSFSTGFKNLQNFTAPANPFLKRNLSRIGQNLKGMFGNLGNAGGRALVGGLNLGGNTAGRLSGFGSSMGGKMRGFGNTASSAVKGGGKKFALASVFGFLLFFLIAMSGNMTGTTPTGNAAPPAPVPPGPITPPIPPVPCTGNDYKACLLANYKLDFQSGFPDSFLKMAYDTLSSADSNAPKFKSLIISSCSSGITVKPTSDTSHVSGCTLNLKTTIGSVALIHELGHVIRNSNSDYYDGIITQARTLDSGEWEGGYLTYYSKYSSRPDDFSVECYTDPTSSLDEEFAESITYFINSSAAEIPMGRGCKAQWPDNPYQNGNRYKGHYNLISGILK